MTGFIQVVTTTTTKEDAQRIAGAVVAQRLAGCVQVIGPITSTYWWEGKIEMAEEWLCLIKSTENVYGRLEKAIRDVHSYEVPEILAVPVAAGSRRCLDWLGGEIRGT